MKTLLKLLYNHPTLKQKQSNSEVTLLKAQSFLNSHADSEDVNF